MCHLLRSDLFKTNLLSDTAAFPGVVALRSEIRVARSVVFLSHGIYTHLSAFVQVLKSQLLRMGFVACAACFFL